MAKLTDADWKKQLTPEQYAVMRQKGTEPPFSGCYTVPDQSGVYHCAACGTALFSSQEQYESTMPGLRGWPSFADVIDSGNVELRPDDSGGMQRTEVVCATCGGHLGHLFDDSTAHNGKHYCINSIALAFNPDAKDKV